MGIVSRIKVAFGDLNKVEIKIAYFGTMYHIFSYLCAINLKLIRYEEITGYIIYVYAFGFNGTEL